MYKRTSAPRTGLKTDLRSRRREQTRTEIVRAAFELFGRDGYETVSMDAIAAVAGVSRATLFNYFPKKELILREIAAARSAKLKAIVTEFAADGETPSFDAVAAVILKMAAENARIAAHSKKLLLATLFQQASGGLLLVARQEAIAVLASAMRRMPERKKPARLVAETLFAVFIATMLEWLMRENAPPAWLIATLRERLQALKEGVA
ncbi:MAG TPA: TetR/AcrR family transcriptional regulator [Acidobacteriaceae bacterium]|jgi:AcrR family transcriptional regulator|nr:TetR/AcrR family transcriptional regulator [Acidobacteriaceae bacterium]